MITPFIGARVHCVALGYTAQELQIYDSEDTDPLFAVISKVYNPRLVDVFVFTRYGNLQLRSNVQLLQDTDVPPDVTDGIYAKWIPGTV